MFVLVWVGFSVAGRLDYTVMEKPQKSSFRINSEELTCSLIQVHKSFNRRNLHTRARQLLPVVPSGKGPHPSQDRVSFFFIYF